MDEEIRTYSGLECEIPIAIKRHYIEKGEKEEEEKRWVIEGYASMEGADRNDPVIIISREAMKDSEDDLKENSTVFLEHQRFERIGKVLDSKVDKKGLWVKILISKTAKDVWKQIQEGVLNALSIGAKILESIKKIDRELGKLVEIVTKMEILEVSLVGLPAHPDTKIISWREEALQPVYDYVFKSLQNFETKNEGGEKEMTQEEIKEEAKEEEKISEEIKEAPKEEESEVKAEEKVEEKTEEKVEEKIEEKVEEKKEETIEKVEKSESEIEEKKDAKCDYEEDEKKKPKKSEDSDIEEAKSSIVGKIKSAIVLLEKAVEGLEAYYKKPEKSEEVADLKERKKKYPKPDEEYEEEEKKKKKPKEEYEEYYKEEKKALEELKKSIEELSKKIIGEDKVKEMAEKITKDVIKKLPEPEEIRKGLEIKEEEEKEPKDPRKRLEKHIEEMVQK